MWGWGELGEGGKPGRAFALWAPGEKAAEHPWAFWERGSREWGYCLAIKIGS